MRTLPFVLLALISLSCAENKPPAAPKKQTEATKTPDSEERSGTEAAAELLITEGKTRLVHAPRAYAARAERHGGGSYQLVSAQSVPEANQKDISWIGAAPGITHAVHGFYEEDGKILLKPVTLSVTDDAAIHRMVSVRTTARFEGVLQPHAITALKTGQLPLPLLETGKKSLFRAQTACIGEKGGPCRVDLSDLIIGRWQGAGAPIPLIPALKHDAAKLAALKPTDELRVTFIFVGDTDTLTTDSADCGQLPKTTPVSTASENLKFAHPGSNHHLNELLNLASTHYFTKFAARPEPVLDFVGAFAIGDCKIAAMAELQSLRRDCHWNMKVPKILVARGSMPKGSVIDLTTSNHAWSMAAVPEAGNLSVARMAFWDVTPTSSPVLDYTVTAAAVTELNRKIQAVAAEADFRYVKFFEAADAMKHKLYATNAEYETAIRTVLLPMIQRLAKPGDKFTPRPGVGVAEIATADQKRLIRVSTRALVSPGRRGELSVSGPGDAPFSVEFGAKSASTVLTDLKVFNFELRDHRKLGAILIGARSALIDHTYPAAFTLNSEGAYAYGMKMVEFFADKLTPAEVTASKAQLNLYRNHVTENWRPVYQSDGRIMMGNASFLEAVPYSKIKTADRARFFRAQGVGPITTNFDVQLTALVHPLD